MPVTSGSKRHASLACSTWLSSWIHVETCGGSFQVAILGSPVRQRVFGRNNAIVTGEPFFANRYQLPQAGDWFKAESAGTGRGAKNGGGSLTDAVLKQGSHGRIGDRVIPSNSGNDSRGGIGISD